MNVHAGKHLLAILLRNGTTVEPDAGGDRRDSEIENPAGGFSDRTISIGGIRSPRIHATVHAPRADVHN